MMKMNICYLNATDDNIPPRSLMHFKLKSRQLCIIAMIAGFKKYYIYRPGYSAKA